MGGSAWSTFSGRAKAFELDPKAQDKSGGQKRGSCSSDADNMRTRSPASSKSMVVELTILDRVQRFHTTEKNGAEANTELKCCGRQAAGPRSICGEIQGGRYVFAGMHSFDASIRSPIDAASGGREPVRSKRTRERYEWNQLHASVASQ